jgi:hypothetical protein
MKLYTKPRPLTLGQLRTGDQVAINPDTHEPMHSEYAFIDADLAERVQWTVVHNCSQNDEGGWTLMHTLGEHDGGFDRRVIVREVVELDPWTYVDRPK